MKQKVTIYRSGGMFGVQKLEAWLFETGRERYAQYDDLPYYIYTQKGKRSKRKGRTEGYKPYVVIVAGWGVELEPDSGFVDAGDGVSKSRYGSCDDRFDTDFDVRISEATGLEILHDWRWTQQEDAAQ